MEEQPTEIFEDDTQPRRVQTDAELALAILVGWASESTIRAEELWKLSDRIHAGLI